MWFIYFLVSCRFRKWFQKEVVLNGCSLFNYIIFVWIGSNVQILICVREIYNCAHLMVCLLYPSQIFKPVENDKIYLNNFIFVLKIPQHWEYIVFMLLKSTENNDNYFTNRTCKKALVIQCLFVFIDIVTYMLHDNEEK